MTLRYKTLTAIGSALVLLIATLYVVSETVMLTSFARLEERDTRQNVQRVLNALADEVAGLNEKSSDWAVWDDTYQFIEDANPDYVKSNLLDRTFADLRLNLMLFVHPSGEVVFGKGFDLENNVETSVPESFLRQISPNSPLLRHTDPDSSLKGILLLSEVPMIVSSRPIVTSEGTGHIRGTLITGRYLDSTKIHRLADITRMSLTMHLSEDPQLPADFQAVRPSLSKDQRMVVRPLSYETVAGYALVEDLFGDPALLLRADMPRAIYQQGKASINYLVALILVVGGVFSVITLLLLEKAVLARLARLNSEVSRIGAESDLSARVTTGGRDELSSLAAATNGMLVALEQAQRGLRAKEERYRAFVEQSSEGIWRVELEQPVSVALPEEEQIQGFYRHAYLAECNDVMARAYGYANASDAVGMRLNSLLDPSGLWSAATLRAFIGSRYRLSNAEIEVPDGQGGRGYFLVNLVGMVEGGALARVWGTRSDITERKRAEEAVRESRRQVVKILEILESITDPFVAVDSQWRLTYMNPRAEQILLGMPAQWLGKNIWDELPEPLRPRLYPECHRAASEQVASEFEDFLPALDRWFAVHIYPYQDGLSVHFRDITERKRLKERLMRAQRLETAGRIAGQVAHDFNNLLGPLVAYPELIKMQLPEGHPAVPYCHDMLAAAERMAHINEEMMTLGRRGHLEQQPTDLNWVARQGVAELAGNWDTRKVELDLSTDLLLASGSPAQMVRVVTNLLSNARDATQEGGTITVRTDNVLANEPFGRYNRIEAGEYVRLSVSDTGSGIASEIQDKIFDAFFTTKDRTQRRGCGLGLSIVQAIVADHRGYLDLESEVGRGASFRVYLPVCREAVQEKDREGRAGGTEAVLVVDDDQLQREVAKELLDRLGYRVVAVAGGEEALAYLKEHPVDLLVLDMVMPGGMDGVETYQRALEMRPGQQAIVLSGFAESERVHRAQSLGAGAYVRKPVTLEKLSRAVREELARRR